MPKFTFGREISYIQYFTVEAETAEQALEILLDADADWELEEKYADGASDILVGILD